MFNSFLLCSVSSLLGCICLVLVELVDPTVKIADEVQDAFSVVLGIIKIINVPTVYAGDPMQAIYDFRSSLVNVAALCKEPRTSVWHFSDSFRFGRDIAKSKENGQGPEGQGRSVRRAGRGLLE